MYFTTRYTFFADFTNNQEIFIYMYFEKTRKYKNYPCILKNNT